jgi:hypothetical protein
VIEAKRQMKAKPQQIIGKADHLAIARHWYIHFLKTGSLGGYGHKVTQDQG